MEGIYNWIVGQPVLVTENVKKIIVVIGLIIVAWIIRTMIVKVLFKQIENVRSRYIWQKTVTYILTFTVLFIMGNIFFKGVRGLTTFLGLLSAGIAIAMKDIFTNIAGWAFIIWVKPFGVTDRIQIGDYSGDVIDISFFQTTLMEIGNWVDADQSTGRVIRIPNNLVFTHSLANYSKGFQFIWNEIPVMITFESNWVKAKEILSKIAKKHAEHLGSKAEKKVKEAGKDLMIFYSNLTPTVYTSVRNSGVLLTIRYLCEPRRRRGTEQAVWEDILKKFADCDDIDFAYPTQRFYHNIQEGKQGIKPSGDNDK